MFRDDTSRAFITGALAFGIPMTGIFLAARWYFGETFPFTAENVLGFTLYYLLGGLLGTVSHFVRVRRIRFSIGTLLLLTFMVSLFATAAVLARDRNRNEMKARTALQDSLGSDVYCGGTGWNYLPLTVDTVYFNGVTIAPNKVPLVVNEINQLPNLKRIELWNVTVSDEDLASLKAALPHVEFQE